MLIAYEKAKEIEKDNIIDAHIDGQPLENTSLEKAYKYYSKIFINQD